MPWPISSTTKLESRIIQSQDNCPSWQSVCSDHDHLSHDKFIRLGVWLKGFHLKVFQTHKCCKYTVNFFVGVAKSRRIMAALCLDNLKLIKLLAFQAHLHHTDNQCRNSPEARWVDGFGHVVPFSVARLGAFPQIGLLFCLSCAFFWWVAPCPQIGLDLLLTSDFPKFFAYFLEIS